MVTVEIPSASGTPIVKPVEVGGGVRIRVEGSHYMMICEVIALDDSGLDDYPIKIKGIGFEGWITLAWVTDVLSKAEYALERALNVIGNT